MIERSGRTWIVLRPFAAARLAWGSAGVALTVLATLALLWPCALIVYLAQRLHQPLVLAWLVPTGPACRPGQSTAIHALPWLAVAGLAVVGSVFVGRVVLIGLLPLYGWASSQFVSMRLARRLLESLASSETSWSAAVSAGLIRASGGLKDGAPHD